MNPVNRNSVSLDSDPFSYQESLINFHLIIDIKYT